MKATLREGEIRWPRRVVTTADALRFLDAVGYCLIFPIKSLALPSLYFAMARREPFTWDRYAMKLWDWKAQLPLKRRAFYGKYFKGRGTFISLEMLPHFLAMRESACAPDDFESFLAAGRISHDARTLWRELAQQGPMATLELRHACKMENVAGNKRYKRAMLELQRLLVVVHFGDEQETEAWPSGRFDLTVRAFPRAAVAARKLSPSKARAAIAAKYIKLHPNADSRLLARIFGWSKEDAAASCRQSNIS
jgi:hypothetical protein